MTNDLLCVIKNRIQQRRQHDVVNLLRYLHNPKVLVERDDTDVTQLSKNAKQGFMKTASALISRLFTDNDISAAESQDEAETMESSDNRQKSDSLLARLQAHIDHSTHNKFDISSCDSTNWLRATIKQEMRWLEATGKRPVKLEQLYNAFLSIPPTSIEAERAFSVAGLFATKFRSRLSDQSVNALSFLRSYDKKNE